MSVEKGGGGFGAGLPALGPVPPPQAERADCLIKSLLLPRLYKVGHISQKACENPIHFLEGVASSNSILEFSLHSELKERA